MLFSPTDNSKRQTVFSVVCGLINLLGLYLNRNSDARRGFSNLGSQELMNEAAVKSYFMLLLCLLVKEGVCKLVATSGYILASFPSLLETFLFSQTFHV